MQDDEVIRHLDIHKLCMRQLKKHSCIHVVGGMCRSCAAAAFEPTVGRLVKAVDKALHVEDRSHNCILCEELAEAAFEALVELERLSWGRGDR